MQNRNKNIASLLALAGILVLINIIASQFFTRIDLTQDKRYSIAPSTKKLLEGLKDVIYVEVYLEGDFPAGLSGFQRLHNNIRETLDEFRVYAGDNIQYKFVEPGAGKSNRQRNEIYEQLAKRGLTLQPPCQRQWQTH